MPLTQPTRQQRGLTKVARRLCLTGFVAFGTLVATLGKACYEVEVPWRDGEVHAFQKPWLFVLLMFLGRRIAGPLHARCQGVFMPACLHAAWLALPQLCSSTASSIYTPLRHATPSAPTRVP